MATMTAEMEGVLSFDGCSTHENFVPSVRDFELFHVDGETCHDCPAVRSRAEVSRWSIGNIISDELILYDRHWVETVGLKK